MSELQMLADALGANERTMRRAVSQGTVRAERPSPRRLRISPAEKRYLRRRWRLLAGLRAALRTEPNIEFALLFGSAARGDDGPRSDIDLIVRLHDPSLVRVLELEERLEQAIGRDFDVLTLDAAERNPPLLAAAVSDGRVLVDRVGLWQHLGGEANALQQRARRVERRATRDALDGIDRMLAR
ncbi:MAG TPA: nucleotidyltransferase domain-containing protein [Solirubrobacterales bacterium]|nr:nucleotidyltransferase domain-containing protein [Solirubrobacterales bacterium]